MARETFSKRIAVYGGLTVVVLWLLTWEIESRLIELYRRYR